MKMFNKTVSHACSWSLYPAAQHTLSTVVLVLGKILDRRTSNFKKSVRNRKIELAAGFHLFIF